MHEEKDVLMDLDNNDVITTISNIYVLVGNKKNASVLNIVLSIKKDTL